MPGLLQHGPIQDLYADGVDHLEVIGANFRIVYFVWQRIDGEWQKVALEWAMKRPIAQSAELGWPLERWRVPVFEMRPFASKLVS